jgi:iron(III) transport system substrate-binding protein
MMMGYWLETMGEDKGLQFIKDFSKQVVTTTQSTRAVEDQVIAGDYVMCPCAVHHTEISKAQGAPVDWVSPGDTVPETKATLSLPMKPKHPWAAMLWIDYMLDPDGGQKVFNDAHYIPSHPQYQKQIPGLSGKKFWVLGEEKLKNEKRWKELLDQYFLH